MKVMTAGEVATAIGGVLVQGDQGMRIGAVSTDSRQISPGSLFFALQGKHHDGHEFVSQAVLAGARGVVVKRPVSGLPAELAVIQVPDTLRALQQLAQYNRNNCSIPVIGVTGSSGKTTTKDMLAAVLSVRFSILKNTGNLNNEIGLPLTLLELGEHHQVLVVEMAMRGRGEIDFLCQLARPTAAVITNIGEAHIERLGSVENIARAKGEILDYIPADGFVLLHAQSPYIQQQALRCRGKVLYFGTEGKVDVRARDINLDSRCCRFVGEIAGFSRSFYLPLPGVHNVINALSVIGAAWQLGLSLSEIADGLASVVLSGMRLEVMETGEITIINDAYNANPSSSRAALQVLAQVAQGRRKIAVFGDMLELGSESLPAHRRIGEEAVATGVFYLVTVGKMAYHIAEGAQGAGLSPGRIYRCNSNLEAVGVLRTILVPGDVLLVKGSRGMHMEEIVNALSHGVLDGANVESFA